MTYFRTALLFVLTLWGVHVFAQQDSSLTTSIKRAATGGSIAGNIIDAPTEKIIEGATVVLVSPDSARRGMESDKNGSFQFDIADTGYYKLIISFVGYATLTVDSIHSRAERNDFNLNDIRLSPKGSKLEEVVVYAEKPLYEVGDGKITFNASESALSNNSNANELLKQAPQVSVNADGAVTVRGKEVKILVDDKPVEMNAQQLQEFLESMPGSNVEKIEVLTNPPPQYATERGGVINIVTKKGKVGYSGRINALYGTRTEAGINGSLTYKNKKWTLAANANRNYNRYLSEGYSSRENIYTDSTNFLNSNFSNESHVNRFSNGASADYQATKRSGYNLNWTRNWNSSESDNISEYQNINKSDSLYRRSPRYVSGLSKTKTNNYTFTSTFKGKKPENVFRVINSFSATQNNLDRTFYQQYLNGAGASYRNDSTQLQDLSARYRNYALRINYDRSLGSKWYLNTGANFFNYYTYNSQSAFSIQKPQNVLMDIPQLRKEFRFYQRVYAARVALRYMIQKGFYVTAGLQREYSTTFFKLKDTSATFPNNYFSPLPFITIQKKWEKYFGLNASYKRTVQRPGIGNLNPIIDFTDPYNIRFGNPLLQPYYADNVDLSGSFSTPKFSMTLSAGFNSLQRIFSRIRTLEPDGKTFLTWENLSGRKEYEAGLWWSLNLKKKLKISSSIGYVYNKYSAHDKHVNRYHDGASFNSSLNGNYVFNPKTTVSGSFVLNRFANPQGLIRNALSMQLGVQQKVFKKKGVIALSIVDPVRHQVNRSNTVGSNYVLDAYSLNTTRNFKLSFGYNFNKQVGKKVIKKPGTAAKPTVRPKSK